MIEVSVLLFTLISEGFIVLLVLLLLGSILTVKGKKRDKTAVRKLVDQIKKQSKARLDTTGSFLHEKYRLEGDALKKAVKSIDKAEKKFIQKMINVYLSRDAKGLASMDACVAELIDAYKSLSPIIPDTADQQSAESADTEKLELLRNTNAKLTEELTITKQTMGSMISEFGSMFGGGQDHELAKHEVVDKVNEAKEVIPESGNSSEVDNLLYSDDLITEQEEKFSDEVAIDVPDEQKSKLSLNPENDKDQDDDDEVTTDEGVDDLINSIDLSDEKQTKEAI